MILRSGAPVDGSRLNLSKGSGFILKRLLSGPKTRKEVYEGTPYEKKAIKDGKFVHGYHSMLWAWLRDMGFIGVETGKVYDTTRPCFGGSTTPCTAVAGRNPVYEITDFGVRFLTGELRNYLKKKTC